MPPEEDRRAVELLLSGLSDHEIATYCLDALRRWRHRAPSEREFSMHGSIGQEIVPLLATRRGVTVDVLRLKEPFLYCQAEPWMRPVVEFAWTLVRSGHAIPLLLSNDGHVVRMSVTREGERLLGAVGDHPLLPDFAARVAARCPGLPESVTSHLSDARTCFEHRLLRPSVVLAGLALEAVVETILDGLVKRGDMPASVLDLKAARRLVALREVTPKLLSGDDMHAALAAIDFADILRRRRNDGAHPTPAFPFDDAPEAEEFLVSAARHLPSIWRLRP